MAATATTPQQKEFEDVIALARTGRFDRVIPLVKSTPEVLWLWL